MQCIFDVPESTKVSRKVKPEKQRFWVSKGLIGKFFCAWGYVYSHICWGLENEIKDC